MNRTRQQETLDFVRQLGVLRPRDLDSKGIPRRYLRQMLDEGFLERPSRGLYILADAEPTEHQSLIEVCKRVPQGVVCLLSALRFHRLTTQAPFEVWLAIGVKARRPRMAYPPLRIVRFSPVALLQGVETHMIQRVPVRATDPARTVVDCFVYRNKVGLDVALEALRDCWRQKRATMDQLYRTAQVRRMANVMRPYLESLV